MLRNKLTISSSLRDSAKGSWSLTSSLAATDGFFFSASRTASIAWKKIHRLHDTIFEHFFFFLLFPLRALIFFRFLHFFFIRYETFPFHFAFFGFHPTFTPEKLKNSSRSSEFTQILKKNTKHSTNIDQLPIFSRKFPSFCLIIPP